MFSNACMAIQYISNGLIAMTHADVISKESTKMEESKHTFNVGV